MRWPRTKSIPKIKDAARSKTRRTNGHSMAESIADLNRTLRGWFEYFQHSHWTTFGSLDRWIRMGLRSLLRKRHKRKGRGSDHQRGPNAYLTDLGLFSLTVAPASVRQSACR